MGNAQSRREAREARRKKNVRKWVALSGAGIVLLSGGILTYNLGSNNQTQDPQAIPSNCATTQRVSVETTKAMAEILKNIPVSDEDCITLAISSDSATTETAQHIISGKSAPNLWIPDSSTRAELALAGKAQVITKADSLASTPAVIATTGNNRVESWNDALHDSSSIKMSDPKDDSGAFMALLNATAETSHNAISQEDFSANIGLRAQTIGVDDPERNPSDLLSSVSDHSIDSAIVTESDFAQYRKDHADSKVKAYVPSGKTGMLDFPMYQPTTGADTNRTVGLAADKIENYINSDEGKKALEEQGLRSDPGHELAENTVGVVDSLSTDNPKIIANMWTSYLRQSAPLNALVAVDASGSMSTKVGDSGRTRMDIVKESIVSGSQLFPPRDSIGLWSFALDIAKDNQGKSLDYNPLVPIRNLGEDVDGKNQREILRTAGEKIQPYPDSHTGLNDTTLAAFEEVKSQFDPDAANVVVIMTDGENSDKDSISTEDLIRTINEQQDKENPIYMLFIGVSDDANMESLRHLAQETKGEAFTANSAEDIQKIFQEALSVADEPTGPTATAAAAYSAPAQ